MGWILAGWIAAQTCDLASTNVALSRPQFTEGNRALGQTRLRINSMKVSVNVGAWLIWRQNRGKHTAWLVPASMIGAGTTACVWNVRQLGR